MPHIAILSASVRNGRNSHRVALYFKKFIEDRNLAEVEILDLLALNFPLFHERLQYLESPSPNVLDFAQKIRLADGIIIVTPEYNGGYPASLKNVIDLLTNDWRRKPVAISTSSDGSFGGTQVITSLQFSLWKIKAWTVPAMFPVPKVNIAFSVDGKPAEPAATDKRAATFVNELLWCIEARKLMENTNN
jgi:NAD(P)H-dependent FMN reductase